MIFRDFLIIKEDGTTTLGPTLHSVTGIREEFHYVSIATDFLSQIPILAATDA